MTTAVVLIESDIKVKDNNSECYIKRGKREINTEDFTTEKQKLMRGVPHGAAHAGNEWEMEKHPLRVAR